MAQALVWTAVPAADGKRDSPVVRDDRGEVGAATAPDLSETELVAACLDGRTDAFDVIVERHRRAVYQLCFRFVANHEDASDLSQDVFLRAYRGLRRFRGQSSLATWLYRIAVNVCLNRMSARRLPTEPIDDHQPLDGGNESPTDRLLRQERALRVRDAVARLPRKQRAALVLRVYHELSHQEIADIVGSSVGAVKANVFHALQRLKRILAEEPAGPASPNGMRDPRS
jgi:RNA polymerase sigma-70 factor (ECF subfamily)